MKTNPKPRPRRTKQRGYALLLVVFLTALVLVASMSVGLRVLTEGRRQKEEDMIWRGKQYTRGIKLYYRKYGRFPKSMDDLTKPGMGNIRFMRQAYKDPMNKEDGAWRLIYVGPAGQLIGSLKPQPANLQMPGAGPLGQPVPGATTTGFGSTGFGATNTAAPPGGISAGFGASTASPSTAAGTAGAPATGTGTGAQSVDTPAGGSDTAIPMGDTPTIVGGNIIGVGSKINQNSVIVYEKAHNYRLFEFIWDPSKDLGIVGAAPGTQLGAPGTPAGTPGQNPGLAPGMTQPGTPPGQQPIQPPLSNPNPNP